jgi:hypothetical protein
MDDERPPFAFVLIDVGELSKSSQLRSFCPG